MGSQARQAKNGRKFFEKIGFLDDRVCLRRCESWNGRESTRIDGKPVPFKSPQSTMRRSQKLMVGRELICMTHFLRVCLRGTPAKEKLAGRKKEQGKRGALLRRMQLLALSCPRLPSTCCEVVEPNCADEVKFCVIGTCHLFLSAAEVIHLSFFPSQKHFLRNYFLLHHFLCLYLNISIS